MQNWYKISRWAELIVHHLSSKSRFIFWSKFILSIFFISKNLEYKPIITYQNINKPFFFLFEVYYMRFDMIASILWLQKRWKIISWEDAYAWFQIDSIINQPAINMKRPTEKKMELCRFIIQGFWSLEEHFQWRNLLEAIKMNEDMVIKIGISIWDLNNCRGNIPLIPHQFYLFILTGRN